MRLLILTLLIIATNTLSAQIMPKKAIAKSGDGIYSILERHHLNSSKYFNAFIELNKEKLGKKNHLIIGESYTLPVSTTKTIKTFDLFGEAYKKVEIKDQQLSGAVFYIVAGHGGPDPGAQGKRDGHTLSEDEYAYDISLRLARELISACP